MNTFCESISVKNKKSPEDVFFLFTLVIKRPPSTRGSLWDDTNTFYLFSTKRAFPRGFDTNWSNSVFVLFLLFVLLLGFFFYNQVRLSWRFWPIIKVGQTRLCTFFHTMTLSLGDYSLYPLRITSLCYHHIKYLSSIKFDFY